MKVAFYDTKSYDRHFFEKALSPEVELDFHEFRLNQANAITAGDCGAVCIFVNDRVDKECIRKLAESGVKLIALRCAGFNNVDIAEAASCGIAVVRVPAYSPHAVAEHAIALLLTLNRKIHRAFNRVREHNFSLNGLVGFDLAGKTAGVVGTGKIGRIAAQILRGFGMRVLAYDPFPANEWARENKVEYVPFEMLLQQSHVVTLHLPLTPESNHLLNDRTLSLMKPEAYLINTSRGKLIDTKALISALKANHLGGVALDVYEEEAGVFFEDLSDTTLQDDVLSRLLTFPNVLVTSHQGFFTQEALGEIARVTCENLLRLQQNQAFVDGTVVK